ncbi:MAG: M6 family metalloprotease domain-containing protein [Muribaculaceae bacterium]|nr:M6 family metalloprotease domain-containing protein [Muribaculaceae bacterium]
MKKLLLLTLSIVVACATAMAVPAKPGTHTVTLPDGSSLQVLLAGDEWHHSFITLDGYTVQQGDDGYYYYVTTDGISKTIAHDAEERSIDEKAFIEANRENMTLHALYEAKMRNGKLRSRTQGVSIKAAEVPTSGSPRIPIILVQYSDISMKHTKANFESHYNTQTWSVLKYFQDQSRNAFSPQFDIYGIFTLPNNRRYYGANNNSGDDQRVGQMVQDAISQAGNNINWAQYDNDGDGYADACIVVYAGPGEAAGATAETIWPCQWYLSSAIGNYVTRNNTKIDKFAVFCELDGDSDSGSTLDGVGTFCHEFSHCLGLPDFYMTTSGSYFGMGDWSLLDRGCYNNDGNRPCGYTAYERNFMGWLNLSTPAEGETYTISTVQDGGQAFKITSNNANEYYIIENIQKTGWNQYARSSGLQVTHVNYNATRWNNNTVNNYSDQGMTIIPADNSLKMNYYSGYGYYLDEADEAGDLYPYNGNDKLTSNSTPAATLYNSSTNLNKPITNITKNSDGTVSFTYMDANAVPGGTASDAYLDIANYETIDEAGWNSTYVNKPYKYTEYQSQQVGWLTMSVFGAWASWRYTANGVTYPQKWITSNFDSAITGTSGTVTQTTWSYTPTYTNPFNGSSAYFSTTTGNGRPRGVGNLNAGRTSSARRSVTFYVTNTTAIKLYGKNNQYSNSGYAALLSIYECELSADGTPIPATNPTKNLSNYDTSGGTSGTEFTIEASDLNDTKIYKVEASIVRGTLFEIAFQTPLNKPKLTVAPTEVYMSTEPGETTTATFNVKGVNLESAVNVALNDANGVFSISPTSISVTNAQASDGADVTVTFSSQNAGNFTGTVTLTSGTLSKTVNLNGICAEKGTAQGEYLDIANYETIGQPEGWYSSSYANPYKYTEYPNEGNAWLTVPASIAYIGYDEGGQGWVGINQYGNPYWYGHQWSATDVFAGHEYFKCDELADADGDYAYMLGANVASSAVTTNTDMFYGMYFVTNCTQVKSYGYNNSGVGGNYPSFIMIYEMTEGADGTLTQAEDAFDVKTNSTANVQYTLTSAELDPEKIYFVAVGGFRGFVYEVSFCTPMEGLPGVPTIVSAEPTATTSEITWTSGEDNDGWNLRYREYVDPEDAIAFFDDFENGLGNWTIYTDGTAPQAEGWTITSNGQLNGVDAVSGSNMASAWSWSNTAYNANNWLITPQVTFGKELSFWVRTAGSWPDSYEVLLSTTGNAESNFNVTLQEMAIAPTNNQWNQVVIDLSDYAGQTGYIAIHHVSEDCNYLLIDDFGIYNELAGEWIEVDGVTSPYTITGLTPETTYEVQVQGVNEIAAGAWTPSTLFTTLGAEAKSLAWICQNGVITEGQNEYIIADKLIAVYADDVKGILWCKDMGNASIFSTSILDGQVDFLKNDPQAQNGRDWDQSNWIALHFSTPTSTNNIGQLVNGAVNRYIKPGTVKGKLIDDVNYALRMDIEQLELVTQADDPDINPDYIPNVYCAANFLPDNLNIHGGIENGDGGYTGNPQINTQNYFFMNPKIQEICEVTYAQWDALKGCFTVPSTSGFDEAFYIGTGYNVIQSQNFTSSLQDEHIYRFKAIVQRSDKDNYGPKNVTTPATGITLYPVDLDPATSEIVTAINIVNVNGEVVGVEYVNSLGVVSKTPFQGVNIVVTRYSDGTKTTVKKIFK